MTAEILKHWAVNLPFASIDMDTWDEAKLAEVVEKKHGENERKMPKTDIICKHFVEALETNKYGWFWECPTGGDKCHYRHALPPGFVLKKDAKKDKKEDISIEDLVERERAKLGHELTRVTLGTFLDWKKRKISEKKQKDIQDQQSKMAEYKAGRVVGLSGKDMFTFNPDLVSEEMDDDEATFNFVREDDDDAGIKEVNFEHLANMASENDGSGTVVEGRQFQVDDDRPTAAAAAAAAEPSDFDADLFGDDEDLDELEKELNALQVDQ